MDLLINGPFDNWTFWKLDILKLDLLIIGPFDDWTFWKLDLLIIGPLDHLKIGPYKNWIFWKFDLFEPTFLKLDSWFYSYYNLQCIKLDQGKKNSRKKISFMHTKNIFKNGFNPILGSIPKGIGKNRKI